MTRVVWGLVLLLVVLHQDNWFWTDGRLVFGFLPVGLFYHMCLSAAAAVVWLLATRYCWPIKAAKVSAAPRDPGARSAQGGSRS